MIPAVAFVAVLASTLGRGLPTALPASEPRQPTVAVLEEVDFIHRTGRCRANPAGEIIEFALTPEAVIEYRNADADLRDLPLGVAYDFTLERGVDGGRDRATVIRDRFTADGHDAQAAASREQRQRYAAFVKARGLPARVERTEGRTLTLAVFGGAPATSEETWPGDSSHPGKGLRVSVANDELRTWNPPVDNEFGKIIEFKKESPGRGLHLVVTVNFMLEGFRRGRYVRIFPDAWRTLDQPFGEQLFHYGSRALPPELAECPAKEYPAQYPFRTDYGNTNLPWYHLRPGVDSPPDSEHRVYGELLAVGADHRSGRFRLDNTAKEVEFSMLPGTKVRSLNADADLAGLPLGERYQFHMYQDDTGAFRRVNFITDEVSELLRNGAVWRIESLNRDEGTLIAARQPPGVRNDQGDPEQPPDIGRALLRFGPETRVWKGSQRVDLAALTVGDLLLVNQTGDRPGHPAHCTDVWIGADVNKPLPNARPANPASSPPKGASK